MTARDFAVQPTRPLPERSRVLALLERYSPSQGWPTLLILVAVLAVVGQSVDAANWVKTPGLYSVLITGVLAGLLLAKVRRPAVLLHLVALGIGTVVVVWHVSSLVEGQPLPDQVQTIWSRLTAWYTAATSGGISTDLLPFTLMILTAAWLLSYLSSWFIFRSNNVWVGVVLSAIAILTNLSFLPDRFATSFFIFMFLAMLLVVRVSVVERHREWGEANIQFSPLNGWLTIHAAVWLSIVAVLVAAVLPAKVYRSPQLSDIWDVGRSPVQSLEDEFGRLFGAVPSRKDLVGRIFGKTLPFLGKVHMDGDVVFWADTKYPSYWASQTYSEYTSRGWVAGDTVYLAAGPETLAPPIADRAERERVTQTLILSFKTSSLLSGGSIDWVSRSAVVQTLKPMEFEIKVSDPSRDNELPQDIQELAQELRDLTDPGPGKFVESIIAKALASDLSLISVTRTSQAAPTGSVLDTVVVQRKAPLAPEAVSWRFTSTTDEDEAYTMVSLVSVADHEDLAEAGSEYGGFITDHYLQLPGSLPQRVRDLAIEITRDAETPYDKALAIQSHLRGSDFVYSQKIKGPPQTADGVDHFLFETKTGYSDYYASSMAVMLRVVEVPARMAAGYAPGEYDQGSDLYFVRDTDSHAWVQVYFPDYGWIDFEPTPAWDPPQRDKLAAAAAAAVTLDLETRTLMGPQGPESIFPDEPIPEDALGAEGGQVSSEFSTDVLVRAAIGVGSAAALWLLLYLIWDKSLGKASHTERAYAKMGRLATLAGLRRRRHQTPMEYAAFIGRATPDVADGAQRIARAFAGNRYGKPGHDNADDSGLEQTWRGIRVALAGRALRRLTPFRGAQAQ